MAEAAHQVDLVGVMIEDRGRHTQPLQHADDDGSHAAETGDDDRITLVVDVIGRWIGPGLRGRLQYALVEDHQHGGQQHRQRHHQREAVGQLTRQHVFGDHETEQDEGELAALRQQQCHGEPAAKVQPRDGREPEDDHGLEHDQSREQTKDHQRLTEQGVEIDLCTDGDEEQAEQQALEGLNIALQLVAVFAVGQHNAGDEGAQRRRQANGPHQEGDANDDQQRNGGEQLADMGAGDDPEQRADGVTPAEDNGDDDPDRDTGLPPCRQVLGQVENSFFAAVTCTVATRIVAARIMTHFLAGAVTARARKAEAPRVRKEREHGEDRDDRDVLEQQHGKGVLSGGGRHLALLIQGLQHDCRRGQGQRQPERQRHTPVQPEHLPSPHMAAAVISTCAPPMPMIGTRSRHSFFGSSSRPTRNSIITTPNSAMWEICTASAPSQRSTGAMATPATR